MFDKVVAMNKITRAKSNFLPKLEVIFTICIGLWQYTYIIMIIITRVQSNSLPKLEVTFTIIGIRQIMIRCFSFYDLIF